MFQMALLLHKENTCATLYSNPCIPVNVQVMAQTSSIYDHFIILPSCVTLTFNLPKQMFQMVLLLLKDVHEQMFQKALLLFKDNTCAKLF